MTLAMLLLLLTAPAADSGAARLNLLYILVDDLRPELGAYGAASAKAGTLTPNLDKLAGQSVVFERAYCQQAVCGPSRNSFLSGRRPDVTKTWTFQNSFRDVGPGWVSMLGFLMANGYETSGQGKIYHPRSPPADDGNKSWSAAFLPYPEWSQGGDPCPGDQPHDPFTERPAATGSKEGSNRRRTEEAPQPADPGNGPACPLAEDANITDGRIADLALANMAKLVLQQQQQQAQGNGSGANPFVLAVGFHKPHLPWAIPASSYAAAPTLAEIQLARNKTAPAGMPEIAFWSCSQSELAGYSNVNIEPQTPLDDHLALQWRQGYYAAVHYTDTQVGRVLDGLAEHGPAVAEQTVTIFHADQ